MSGKALKTLAMACVLAIGAETLLAGQEFLVKAGPLVWPFVRKQELQVRLWVENPADAKTHMVASAIITDFKTGDEVLKAENSDLDIGPKFSGETFFTIPAAGLKTWSHWNPQLYNIEVSLKPDKGDEIKLEKARFGYREIWTENGYFYLNGKRLFLPGGNHGGRRREEEMKYAKLANLQADTIRGAWVENSEPWRVAELSDIHGHYIFYFNTPKTDDLEFKYSFGNHPSIVGFSLWTKGYYSGPHGHPMQVGGIVPEEVKKNEKEKSAFEIPRQYKEWDPTRVYGHYVRGVGGEFRSLMWDLSWGTQAQEQEEWMKVWGENREKIEPFFPQEFALMRLGSNMVNLDRHFGPNSLIEHMARYLGEKTYEIVDDVLMKTYLPRAEISRQRGEQKQIVGGSEGSYLFPRRSRLAHLGFGTHAPPRRRPPRQYGQRQDRPKLSRQNSRQGIRPRLFLHRRQARRLHLQGPPFLFRRGLRQERHHPE